MSLRIDMDDATSRHRLWSARKLDGVIAIRQANLFAIGSIDLRVKAKVRREALGGRWINAQRLVADDKGTSGGCVVFIVHVECDLPRGFRGEKHRNFTAETEILLAETAIRNEAGFALSGITAVNLKDAILHAEAGKLRRHRREVIHRERNPAPLGFHGVHCAVGEIVHTFNCE